MAQFKSAALHQLLNNQYEVYYDIPGLKLCYKCEIWQSFDEFSKDAKRSDGVQSQCKTCASEYKRVRYSKDVMFKAKHKRKTGDNRRRITEYIREKKNVPCLDCKQKYHYCQMDFDHVTGIKKFQLSSGTKMTFSQVVEEIQKCEVVCSNCHRLRTLKRATGQL